MRVINRASLSYLLRHPWQLALAVVGITIGVAVMVSIDLTNSSARRAFLLSMDAITGEATHQIVGGPRGVREEIYVDLRVRHGLTELAPIVEGDAKIGDHQVRVLGLDLFAEQAIRKSFAMQSLREANADVTTLFRDFLTRPNSILLSARFAGLLGLEVGESIQLEVSGRSHRIQLIGLFGVSEPGFDNLIVTDISNAQHWLRMEPFLSRIDVRIDGSDGIGEVELGALLPGDVSLLSASGRTRSTADMSRAFMTNLTAMSLLAMLVGLFLIYNSVSFSVLLRRRLIGILRLMGMTRREIMALILIEAALIGLVGSLIGIALGILLGQQLLGMVTRSINDFYFQVSVNEININSLSLVKGLVVGIGAALLASAIPALEASSYHPRMALLRSSLEHRAGRLLPLLLIAGVFLMVIASLLLWLSSRSLVAGLTALFLLILGFSLCIPYVVQLMVRLAAPLAQKLGGTWARLGISGISATLSRTGVAIVALAVAVSATIGVTVMVNSFRGSVNDWLEQTLRADVYFGAEQGGLDSKIINLARTLPGVAKTSNSRRVAIESSSGTTHIQVLRMVQESYGGVEILDADPKEVWPQWENQNVVLASEPYAYRFGFGPGDTVNLRTDNGDRPFRIAATYQSYDINASGLLMSRATYERHWKDRRIDSMGLYLEESDLEEGVAVKEIIDQLEKLSRDQQKILINSSAQIRKISLDIFDRTFVITHVLYWLASGVALVGILGAMLALQLERAREFATLRALGMTPSQLGGMISLQSASMGLMAGLAAIPLGLVMAYVLINVINQRAFGWKISMTVGLEVPLTALVFALIAALTASLYPAWRAAHSTPAIAMREE